MGTVFYTTKNRVGCVSRWRVEGAARVEDKPYPPGGMLRYCYNEQGQVIHGPYVPELLSWEFIPD